MSEATKSRAGDLPGQYPWEASYPANLNWSVPLDIVPMTNLMDEAFDKRAKHVMIEYEGCEISYVQMAGYVERVAHALGGWGAAPGDTVALYFPNSPYHVICLLAALKAGCRVLSLSPLDALRELRYKLEDSGARTLLTLDEQPFTDNAATLIAEGTIKRWVAGNDRYWTCGSMSDDVAATPAVLTDAIVGPKPPARHWPPAKTSDVALLQYTGGTTGAPKAAIITHGNLAAGLAMFNARFHAEAFSRPGREKLLGVLPLFHIYALVSVVLRSISVGDAMVLRRRFDVLQTLRDCDEGRVTWFFGVPTMFVAICDHPDVERYDLRTLSCCIAGGAPLPTEVERRFAELTGRGIGVGWGMTESMGAGTMTDPGRLERVGTIGLPLPGATIRIVDVDDPDRILGIGETGEICMAGPHICDGYWNRPEETAATFRDGWLLTGDIGRMDEEGFVYLIDRKKDLIISGGFNVYPRMIEEAIYEHEAVEEVLVFGIPDAYRGEAAKTAIKLKSGFSAFSLDELREFLSSRVGRHELPVALEFRDSLPRTAVGKLSRKELVAEERARRADTPLAEKRR